MAEGMGVALEVDAEVAGELVVFATLEDELADRDELEAPIVPMSIARTTRMPKTINVQKARLLSPEAALDEGVVFRGVHSLFSPASGFPRKLDCMTELTNHGKLLR